MIISLKKNLLYGGKEKKGNWFRRIQSLVPQKDLKVKRNEASKPW